jgi:hypothetical protein
VGAVAEGYPASFTGVAVEKRQPNEDLAATLARCLAAGVVVTPGRVGCGG